MHPWEKVQEKSAALRVDEKGRIRGAQVKHEKRERTHARAHTASAGGIRSLVPVWEKSGAAFGHFCIH